MAISACVNSPPFLFCSCETVTQPLRMWFSTILRCSPLLEGIWGHRGSLDSRKYIGPVRKKKLDNVWAEKHNPKRCGIKFKELTLKLASVWTIPCLWSLMFRTTSEISNYRKMFVRFMIMNKIIQTRLKAYVYLHQHLYQWDPEPRLYRWGSLIDRCLHCSVWWWVPIDERASCKK